MESWRKVWRDGVAPLLSVDGLEALRQALATDDVRLIQGATTTPPPLQYVHWPVKAACLISYAGVDLCGGFDHATVGDVEEFFTRMCVDIDQRLGEPAGCRWFLNWFDETPRDEMRALLLPEVERSLALMKEAS